MKLEIGSGRKPSPGYTHLDIEPYSDAEIVGDFRTMNFENLEEIKAMHLLEHFGREEGVAVLKLWYSWLAPAGRLIVETPDFEAICQDWAKDPYWMTRHAYGSQEAPWAFHRDGWYQAKFEEVLPQVGFKIEGIKKTHSRKILPNIYVVARK